MESDESACSACRARCRRTGCTDEVGIFADGVAVKQIGLHPFEVAREFVDEVVTVTTDEICAAIKDVFDDTRSIAGTCGSAFCCRNEKAYIERERLSA